MWHAKELVRPKRSGAGGGAVGATVLLHFENVKKDTAELTLYRKRIHNVSYHSSIHGVPHAAMPHIHLWQSYFWLLVVITATAGSCIMYTILSSRHNEQQLITVVETTRLPVFHIEFPAVALCPWHRVNWLRFQAAAERFLPPMNSTTTTTSYDGTLSMFEELLIGMEHLSFGAFEYLKTFASHNISASIANISLVELAKFVAVRCDELFLPNSCIFDESPYDCCKLFVLEHTEKGLCFVFNSMVSENSRKKRITNPYYPLKLSTAGEGSGLIVTLRSNGTLRRTHSITPFAVNVMVKRASQWSVSLMYRLYSNTENLVAVQPILTETSSNTYYVKPEKRRCYFDYEKHPYFKDSELRYGAPNCFATCQQNYLLRYCNCTMPLFFPRSHQTRECLVPDFQCLYENRDIFSHIKLPGHDKYINDPRRGMSCNCLPNCDSLNYLLTLNVKKLDRTTNYNASNALIKANIHFSQPLMTKYETKLEYTYLDLIANFGGIVALFLGCSILSGLELAYMLLQVFGMLKSYIRRILK